MHLASDVTYLALFGVRTTKTTKVICGRQVSTSTVSISNTVIDCPECQQRLRAGIANTKRLSELMPQIHTLWDERGVCDISILD